MLSCSKDGLIKIFDIRMMKELFSLKGHKKEVTGRSIVSNVYGVNMSVDLFFWQGMEGSETLLGVNNGS